MYVNKNNITIEDSPAFKQLKKFSGMSEDNFSKKIFDLIQTKMGWVFQPSDLTDQPDEILNISIITEEEIWNPQELTNELMRSTNELIHSILLAQVSFIEYQEPIQEEMPPPPDLSGQGNSFGMIGF